MYISADSEFHAATLLRVAKSVWMGNWGRKTVSGRHGKSYGKSRCCMGRIPTR